MKTITLTDNAEMVIIQMITRLNNSESQEYNPNQGHECMEASTLNQEVADLLKELLI